jgi:hypothetical protein
VHNFVKTRGTPRAGLEIDKSVTIQTVCMQAVVKATSIGKWVLQRCSRSHRAIVASDDDDCCLVEGVNRSTRL